MQIIMEKLDIKDRKILYYLDLNSRQSFSQIGKKVGLHKDSVAHRVKRLQEKGIIVRFNTLIDSLKLGYTCMRFYLNFQYITPEIKKEIIDHFVHFKHTQLVASPEGGFELCVFMLAKNVIEIHSFWQKTLSKYRDYFSDQIITPFIGENIYSKSFLIDEKDDRINLIVESETIGRVLVSIELGANYHYGDLLKVTGKLLLPKVYDDFNYREFLAKDSIFFLMYYPEIEILAQGQGNRILSAVL